MTNLLTAAPRDRKALAELKRLGFAEPGRALANLHAMTPDPRDAELLSPLLLRLLQEMAEAPDPDMALNNLERLAAQGERVALFRLLGGHPGALHLVARVGGTSQFLADTLRRRPTLLSWLLEPGTMRPWLADELAAGLTQSASAFTRPEARWNALRRFKYRQLLRIASRDILGDADLTVTTEELSRMADVCLAAAWRWTEEDLGRRFGQPRAEDGTPTGFAVIGMGKLGGDELNYSSDIDLVFVYGDDGFTSGGDEGSIANGDYFAAGARTSWKRSSPSRTKAMLSGWTCACVRKGAWAASSSRSPAMAPTSRSGPSSGSGRPSSRRASARGTPAWARASSTSCVPSSSAPGWIPTSWPRCAA
jgi:glutamate-ammonia-ligase adenylyltransferase